jgi:hypothetical protein
VAHCLQIKDFTDYGTAEGKLRNWYKRTKMTLPWFML